MSLWNTEQWIAHEQQIEKDYDSMRLMFTLPVRKLAEQIEDICDRMEYEGSFLYDEIPDKTTILALADRVAETLTPPVFSKKENKSPSEENPTADLSQKDLIQTLLCAEIFYRRCRYYRKRRFFEPV